MPVENCLGVWVIDNLIHRRRHRTGESLRVDQGSVRENEYRFGRSPNGFQQPICAKVLRAFQIGGVEQNEARRRRVGLQVAETLGKEIAISRLVLMREELKRLVRILAAELAES